METDDFVRSFDIPQLRRVAGFQTTHKKVGTSGTVSQKKSFFREDFIKC